MPTRQQGSGRPTGDGGGTTPGTGGVSEARVRTLAEAAAVARFTPEEKTKLADIEAEADKTGLPAYLQAASRFLRSQAGNLFWSDINAVPNAPGSAASVGRVLTVTGENEKDYGWRDAPSSSSEGTGEIADNSILPIKAQADTPARQKAWRDRFDSAKIDAGNILPVAANTNIGDVHIFTQDVAAGVSWRDLSDSGTEITSAAAGDVGVYFDRLGWVRVGNILSLSDARILDAIKKPRAAADRGKVLGVSATDENVLELHAPQNVGADAVARAAAAAAQTKANANEVKVQRLVNQPHFEMVPGFIYGGNTKDPLGTYHILMQTHAGAYPTANSIRLRAHGAALVTLGYDPALTQRVLQWEISAVTAQNLANNSNLNIGATLDVDIELRAPGAQPGQSNSLATFRVNIPIIAKPAHARARFESVVGASPAVLPVGTEEIVGHMTKQNKQGRFLFSISLADIPAVNTDFHVDSRNPVNAPTDDQSVGIRLAYVPATRTLTYSPLPVGAGQQGNGVIGSIRARGFA